jgi:hypothetical protein
MQSESRRKVVKPLPCIYGERVTVPCPVRMTMQRAKHEYPDISKYVRPNTPHYDEIQKLIEKEMQMIHEIFEQELSHLSSFCQFCPDRILYLQKQGR